jgi:cupin superfamily acireductone dioxygenase involved in methionine salvage
MSDALQEFRQRMAERGYKRVEVCVAMEDAQLMRRVAKVLSKNRHEAQQLRRLIDGVLPAKSRTSYKEWLASLPDE